MENLKVNYNKFRESLEQTKNENFKKSSIFFSRICDPTDFEFCNEFWSEFTLKSSINVPNSYDSIDQIDTISSNLEITSSKVIQTPSIPNEEVCIKNFENKLTTGRKLVVSGFLCLTINYISIYKDKNVQSFSVKIPFSNFIVLSKYVSINNKFIDPLNVEFLASACLENINVTEINNRNIKFTTNIFLTACCSECVKNENSKCFLNSNLFPEIYGLCNKNILNNLLISDINSINYWNQISLSKIFTLPLDKPDIIQILSVSSKFKLIDKKFISTPKSNDNNLNNLSLTGKKLIVNGLLCQRMEYISKTENQEVISIDIIIPISSYIMLPNNYPYYNKFNICFCLENVDLCCLNNRQVFSSAVVFLKAKPKQCSNIC